MWALLESRGTGKAEGVEALLRSPVRLALGTAVAAALLVSPPARALDPDIALGACTVESWGARKGLPSSYVRAIAQTADGYLWIAGYGGVGRYDGSRIVSLPQPAPVAHTFDTITFKVDQSGTLWLVSSKGTPVCVRDGVTASCFAEGIAIPDGERPVDVHPERDGTALLATRTGLYRYLPGPSPRLDPVPIPDVARAVFIHRDLAGRLWLGSESGLYQAEKDGRFVPVTLADGALRGAVRALFETRAGRLWFLVDSGLVRVEGQEATRFFPPGETPLSGPSAVIEDGDGNVWIATREGLKRFRDGRWVTYTKADGLPDDFITALYEDREGSLWVGTRSGGIAQFTDRVVASRAGPPSLHDERWQSSISQDSSGAYWFGSRRGLLRWKDGQERLFTERDGLPHPEVFAVASGRDGEIWVGTGRGFARLSDGGASGRIEVPASWGEVVTAVQPDGDVIWLGSEVNLLRFQGGKLESVGQSPHGPIRHIETDQSGQLWIAANRGVSRLEGGRLVPVALPGGDYPARALFRDGDGRLWLTTGTDIARLSPGPIRFLGPTVALGGRQLFQMIEDNHGAFWLGTSRGLLRIPKDRVLAVANGERTSIDPLSLETDDRRRDIIANNTRDPGTWKDSHGRLWFATDTGTLMIDPARLPVNAHPPPIRIDEASADAQPLKRGVLNVVEPGPGNLAFRFSAVTLLEPHKSLHRYRLEGFDQDWINAGAARAAHYTNIPPGTYRFRVQGSNADGMWNVAGDVIELRLRPHFYETTWFYGVVVLAAGLALVLLWRQRVRRLERDYLAALAERSRVARELHDTLLQGMSAAALRLRGLARRLGADKAAAGELAAVDNLVVTALQETRQFLGGLRGQSGSSDLAAALGRLAHRLTEDRAIPCVVVVEGEATALPDDVKGDLFRIAQEAIHNAVKHANPRRIEVKLRYEPEAAALTVADDGCGFDPAEAVGEAEGHFGLVGMRERADRVGQFKLTSNPGQGTTVEVRVALAAEETVHG